MMEKYELDFLVEEFGKHGNEFCASPHYKSEDFNLPIALKTLVEELQTLKAGLKNLEKGLQEMQMYFCNR
jgi:hypothetical protein